MSFATSGRTTLTGVAVVLGLGLLAGCSDSTGENALTNRNYYSADGVMGNSGLITARNVLLVSSGRGATLIGAFGNNGNAADSVTSISSQGVTATVQDPGGLSIDPAGALTFGAPETAGGPQAFLTGTYVAGTTVGLTVRFATASDLVLQVPVLPHDGYYTAVPTAAATTPASAAPVNTAAASTAPASTAPVSAPAVTTAPVTQAPVTKAPVTKAPAVPTPSRPTVRPSASPAGG